MPRTKAAPVKRLKTTATGEQQDAALLALGQQLRDEMERQEIETWEATVHATTGEVNFSAVPASLTGLAKLSLATDDHDAFCLLHDAIVERHNGRMASWGGTEDTSGRQRCYGYFRNALSERHLARGHAMREYDGDDGKAGVDRSANRRASTLLEAEELPDGFDAALGRLCTQVKAIVPDEYAPVLSPEHLVAAQPNLHNGQRFLKPHLDEPLHDGFGVVIVTVAVRSAARILLQTAAGERHCFPLDAARHEAYVLSAAARNTALHGVLGEDAARCSLNLRFGLHSADPAGTHPAAEVGFAPTGS